MEPILHNTFYFTKNADNIKTPNQRPIFFKQSQGLWKIFFRQKMFVLFGKKCIFAKKIKKNESHKYCTFHSDNIPCNLGTYLH